MNKDHKKVMIIGNGVSRLNFQKEITEWDGEIWGCNSVYLEVASGSLHRLDRIIGDKDATKKAIQYKNKYGYNYVVYNKFVVKKKDIPGAVPITLPKRFIRDSGSTLVAMAIIEGYEEIVCVGFDLGGKDIYVKNHQYKNKATWIRNWRRIAYDLSLRNVTFLGKDHKPYIMSKDPEDAYAIKYMRGEDHLGYVEKSDVKFDEKILLIDKKELDDKEKFFVDEWDGEEVWVFGNKFQHKKVTRYFIENERQANKLLKNKTEDNQFSIYSFTPIEIDGVKYIKEERSEWNKFVLTILQGMYEDYKEIYIMPDKVINPDSDDRFNLQLKCIQEEYPIIKIGTI